MPDIFTSSSAKPKPAPPKNPSVQPISYTKPTLTSPPVSSTKQSVVADPVIGKPASPMKLFSTFITNPTGVTFADQDPDENVVLFFRSDFITNVPWIFFTIVLLVIPLVIGILGPLSGFSLGFITPQLVLIMTIFYYLLVFSYDVINFMYWFYNVGIVSTKHIIDVDYTDITYKNISTTTMQEVSDIDYTQKGFIQTFFDFGNVEIRTQGSNFAIKFLRVPQPGKIVDIILKIREGVATGG